MTGAFTAGSKRVKRDARWIYWCRSLIAVSYILRNEKYTGLYDLVYFDPSKLLGKNPNPAADALCGGVLTIYAVYSAAGAVEFCVAALLGCTAEERKKVAGMLEGMDLKRDGAQVYTHYESAARSSGFSGDDGSRMKCLYSGKLSLSQEMVDITLQQVTGGDIVHLLAHNRAATSSAQKEYKGGLAAMLSVSHGTEHMPCIQTVSLLKGAYIEALDEQEQTVRTPKNKFPVQQNAWVPQGAGRQAGDRSGGSRDCAADLHPLPGGPQLGRYPEGIGREKHPNGGRHPGLVTAGNSEHPDQREVHR